LSLWIGMSALGALLGVWIALSKSAVVVTVLPLIFALIGGSGGYWVLKADLSKESNLKKIRLLSLSLTALCLSCIVTMTATIFIVMAYSQTVPIVDINENALSNIMIREKLLLIGASNNEVHSFLLFMNPKPAKDVDIANILNHAAMFNAAFDKLGTVEKEKLHMPIINGTDLAELSELCEIFTHQYKLLTTNNKKISPKDWSIISKPLFDAVLETWRDSVLVSEASKILLSNNILLEAWTDLTAAVNSTVGENYISVSSSESEKLDKLVSLAVQAPPAEDKSPSIARAIRPDKYFQYQQR